MGGPRPDSDLDLAVDLAEAPLELKAKVIREGELVYSADEPARVAFQVRTLSEFLDFEPTLRDKRELECLRDLDRDSYITGDAYAGRYLVQAAAIASHPPNRHLDHP